MPAIKFLFLNIISFTNTIDAVKYKHAVYKVILWHTVLSTSYDFQFVFIT